MADIVPNLKVDPSPPLLIGGRPVKITERFDDIEPSSGRLLSKIPLAGPEHVEMAAVGAAVAQARWAATPIRDRGASVRAFAERIRELSHEIAHIDSIDSGNPKRAMLEDVRKGAAALDFFAGIGPELQGRTIPATTDHLHFTVHEPIGIVGVITAFNHPALFALARMAAPLVAGNAVLLKPPEQAPLSSMLIGAIAEEFFPSGLITVLPGAASTGAAVVSCPAVGRIAFTGSVATALAIQRQAAETGTIRRLSFELGGKNPLIVLPDVPADEAAQAAVDGMNLQRVLGQSCGSTSRAFVHEVLYDQFLERVARRFEALRPGRPEEHETDLGPLISAEQLAKVSSFVEDARASGANIVTGGRKTNPPNCGDGFYYAPTLIASDNLELRAAREEIFGPVLVAIPWSDEDEMVTAVNSTRYGLTAAVYTRELSAALRLTQAIRAGYVWVNDVEKRWLGVPFGGRDDSGTATEYSIEELYDNTYLKSVSIRR